MNNKAPWDEKWAILKSFPESGQGQASLVQVRGGSQRGVLKVLKDFANPKARSRMFSEVEHLALAHSQGANVPKVIDSNITPQGLCGGEPLFFVMDYVEGETLSELLKGRGPLALEKSVAITLDLCRSLKAAYPLVHRDIKPDNLKIRDFDKPEVVLLDFGIAFNLEANVHMTDPEERLGNKFLILPELRGIDENKRDPRSDLTLACGILFFCLTGKDPCNLSSSSEMAPHKFHEDAVRQAVGDKWPKVSAFFARGFRVNIDHRFQNIDQIMEQLAQLPVQAHARPDLKAIAADAEAAFRKTDLKTRVKACSEKAKSLKMRFQDELKKLLGTSSLFRVSISTDEEIVLGFHDRPEENVRLISAGVFTEERKDLTKSFFLTIDLDGAECVVRKQWFTGKFGISELINRVNPTILGEEIVYRYPEEQSPDLAILTQEFIAAVAEAIESLKNDLEREAREAEQIRGTIQQAKSELRKLEALLPYGKKPHMG